MTYTELLVKSLPHLIIVVIPQQLMTALYERIYSRRQVLSWLKQGHGKNRNQNKDTRYQKLGSLQNRSHACGRSRPDLQQRTQSNMCLTARNSRYL